MENFSPPTNCSDEELLTLYSKGQREAFGILVRRYQGELFGYLRRYLGDASLAEDVFQNTFLAIFTKVRYFEQGRAFRPWLYTIATNQSIDLLRQLGRRIVLSLDQEIETNNGTDSSPMVETLEGRGPSPLDHVQAEERRQMVRTEVDRLPEFLRQVVILSYYQGLKHHEIAEVLDIPLGTVKSRLHSAIAKLNAAWNLIPALKE